VSPNFSGSSPTFCWCVPLKPDPSKESVQLYCPLSNYSPPDLTFIDAFYLTWTSNECFEGYSIKRAPFPSFVEPLNSVPAGAFFVRPFFLCVFPLRSLPRPSPDHNSCPRSTPFKVLCSVTHHSHPPHPCFSLHVALSRAFFLLPRSSWLLTFRRLDFSLCGLT